MNIIICFMFLILINHISLSLNYIFTLLPGTFSSLASLSHSGATSGERGDDLPSPVVGLLWGRLWGWGLSPVCVPPVSAQRGRVWFQVNGAR